MALALWAAFASVVWSTTARSSAPAGEALASPRWARSFAAALEEARVERKMIMVDFFTSWCGWCKVLDKKTYTDPAVIERSTPFVSVKVNAESDAATAKRYNVRAYPTILFLQPDGTPKGVVQGFRPPEQFGPLLARLQDHEQDLRHWASEVDRTPRSLEARSNYAHTLALAKRWGEAVAQLDTVLLLDEITAETIREIELDRAGLRLHAGDAEGARDELLRWLASIPRPHAREAEADFLLARAEDGCGRTDEAAERFSEIVQRNALSWYADEARRWLASHGE